MARFFTLRSLTLIFALFMLGGCGLLPQQIDETADWSAERLYREARTEMDEGGYSRAIELFEKLESRYPYGRHAQQAQIEVAYAYYQSDQPEMAIASVERFIRLHPNHPHVDYAYYLRGLISFNEDLGILNRISRQDLSERDPQGMQESFQAFQQLVTRFPESRYAPDATQRMQYLVNSMAQHELHVGRYYFKRGAYVAAANRAQTAILNYPDTPAVEEALFLLRDSYAELGMDDLREDTDRIIAMNYADSVYHDGGPEEEDKPWWQLW